MTEFELLTRKTASFFNNSNAIISRILHEAAANDRCKMYLSNGCDKVKITPTNGFDSHYLILKLDENLNATVLSHSLPVPDRFFKQFGTIEAYSGTFFSLLEQMEAFYCQMNTIDELTFVVDPVDITTKHNYRIIKLENRVFMKITVDPFAPSSVTTTFYGPTKQAERYRSMYQERIDDWNTNDDIYRNFLKIFDIMSFPQKSLYDTNNITENCSICYMYRFNGRNGRIPIVTCDNEKCRLIYHTSCLQEWVSTLSDTKTFLNTVSGRCPSCKEKLSTAFSDLLNE